MPRHPRGAAALLAALLLAPAVPAADPPTDKNLAADRLTGDAARMHGFVTTPHPGELKWQQIPWLTDLREALRQARAEGRPVLLFVSGDDPLEKC